MMRRLLAFAGLVAATEALLALAPYARAPLLVDVGPSTGAYGAGFTDSEERPPTTFRWTRGGAGLGLPVVGSGGQGVLAIRFGRHVETPTRVQVLLSGNVAAEFEARPGGFRTVRLPVALPQGPLRIDLWPSEGAGPGVAVDWIRIEQGRWRIPLGVWQPRALVAGVFLLCLAGGFAPAGALVAAGVLATVTGLWAARDPFACAHVLTRIALPALILSSLALLFLRRRPGGRWVTLIFLAGYLLKGAGLFYPTYFYNDVRNNRRFAMALARPGGLLPEQRRAAQVAIGVAYPRTLGAKKYAFPYSPVFYLPFALVRQDPTVVDEGMKHLVLALTSAEVVLVFWISGLVFGAGSGVVAALIAALLPIFYSRLLLALWTGLAGHFWDTLLLGAALGLAVRPESRRRLLGFAAAAQGSLLTYVASLLNVPLFAGILALLCRRIRWPVLVSVAVATLLTVGVLYADFTLLFLAEILPAFLAARGGQDGPGVVGSAASALSRIPIFYGWAYPAFTVAGFLLARRKASPEAVRVLAAYALAFAGLVALRALPGGLFKDMKEMEFVAPLVAVLAGATLEELARRGRSGWWAAALVATGLAVFGLDRYAEYFGTWTALAGR